LSKNLSSELLKKQHCHHMEDLQYLAVMQKGNCLFVCKYQNGSFKNILIVGNRFNFVNYFL